MDNNDEEREKTRVIKPPSCGRKEIETNESWRNVLNTLIVIYILLLVAIYTICHFFKG